MTPNDRKPGRPKEYDKRTATALRFSPELHQWITNAAKERDVSFNWMVNRGMEFFMARLVPIDELVVARDEPNEGGPR